MKPQSFIPITLVNFSLENTQLLSKICYVSLVETGNSTKYRFWKYIIIFQNLWNASPVEPHTSRQISVTHTHPHTHTHTHTHPEGRTHGSGRKTWYLYLLAVSEDQSCLTTLWKSFLIKCLVTICKVKKWLIGTSEDSFRQLLRTRTWWTPQKTVTRQFENRLEKLLRTEHPGSWGCLEGCWTNDLWPEEGRLISKDGEELDWQRNNWMWAGLLLKR